MVQAEGVGRGGVLGDRGVPAPFETVGAEARRHLVERDEVAADRRQARDALDGRPVDLGDRDLDRILRVAGDEADPPRGRRSRRGLREPLAAELVAPVVDQGRVLVGEDGEGERPDLERDRLAFEGHRTVRGEGGEGRLALLADRHDVGDRRERGLAVGGRQEEVPEPEHRRELRALRRLVGVGDPLPVMVERLGRVLAAGRDRLAVLRGEAEDLLGRVGEEMGLTPGVHARVLGHRQRLEFDRPHLPRLLGVGDLVVERVPRAGGQGTAGGVDAEDQVDGPLADGHVLDQFLSMGIVVEGLEDHAVASFFLMTLTRSGWQSSRAPTTRAWKNTEAGATSRPEPRSVGSKTS